MTKPFGMEELLARMRAALRHQLQVHGERPVFRVGELSVDLVRRIVKVGDEAVKLSPKEYDLLRVLVQHAGKVLTHKFLLSELWDALTDAQYLRVYVRQAPPEDRSRPRAPAIRPDGDRDRLPAARSGMNWGPTDFQSLTKERSQAAKTSRPPVSTSFTPPGTGRRYLSRLRSPAVSRQGRTYRRQ